MTTAMTVPIVNNLPIDRFVVIGSYPLGIRSSKDIDVVCYKKDIKTEYTEKDEFSGIFEFNGRNIELLFADEQDSFQYLLERGEDKRIASIEELYAIKKGHIIFPNKTWEKHIIDLALLKQLIDARHFPYGESYINKELIKLHRKSTEYRLGKRDRTPKLNGVTKEEFFDDKVTKFFDHDDIHQLFAHRDKAMYRYMQRDESLVQCDKDLWNAFTYEEKLWCVMEEAYVIASERHIIPTLKGVAVGLLPQQAFKWALMRICTNLCSGWFRDFAIDNYVTAVNNYNKNFYLKLGDLFKDEQ